MIALTAEMRAAAARRMGVDDLDPWTVAALVDVLALVERDREVQLSKAYVRGWEECIAKGAANAAALAAARQPEPARCSACGRTARHLTPVTELVDGRTTVVARLGPSCHTRYLRSGGGRQALPIGGPA